MAELRCLAKIFTSVGICNSMRGSLSRQWLRSAPPWRPPYFFGPKYGAIISSQFLWSFVNPEFSRDFVSSTRGHVSTSQQPQTRSASNVFTRRLNIFSVFSKEAREKEKERLKDELNRGYFDDLRDMKKSGGKVAPASTSLIPIAASPKFPLLEVYVPKGPTLALPIENSNATLICMAFRASAQPMVVSWSSTFAQKFGGSAFRDSMHVFEVSVIESPVLSLWPIKRLLLRIMRGSPSTKEANELERKVVYAFGDTYDFRKVLGVPNLLSGYVFLLDRKGRVRWRASGMASKEELESMASCTTRLLQEETSKTT